MSMSRSNFKVVWGAIERRGKTLWSRVGLAWEAKDGALFAQLNAIPLSGRICIREGTEENQAAAPVEVAR
jgi:hypothetical protein